jgi:hypothetical protein
MTPISWNDGNIFELTADFRGGLEMKASIAVFTFAFALIAFAGVSQAVSSEVSYNPVAKFWMEKFQGGGPGKLGNVLMAIGEGFVFQNAVLAVSPEPQPLHDWCDDLGGAFTLMTVYNGGMLTLNPSGPWKKNYKAKNVTAINFSCHAADYSLLGFRLLVEPTPFERPAGSQFRIEAGFDVMDDNYEIKVDPNDGMVFQRGYDDLFVTIWIQ